MQQDRVNQGSAKKEPWELPELDILAVQDSRTWMEKCTQACWAWEALQEWPTWKTLASTYPLWIWPSQRKKDHKDHSDPSKCHHSLKEVSTGLEISRLPVIVISTMNITMKPI